jgi:hypothetical protein
MLCTFRSISLERIYRFRVYRFRVAAYLTMVMSTLSDIKTFYLRWGVFAFFDIIVPSLLFLPSSIISLLYWAERAMATVLLFAFLYSHLLSMSLFFIVHRERWKRFRFFFSPIELLITSLLRQWVTGVPHLDQYYTISLHGRLHYVKQVDTRPLLVQHLI